MTEPNVQPLSEPAGEQPQQSPTAASAADERKLAALAHFLNIILLIPTLIIYLVFKDRGEFVRDQSKEALNWTINVTGAVVALNILIAILGFIPILGLIAWLLLTLVIWAIIVINVIFAIIGGVKVNNGEAYRYPLNRRWIT